MILNTRIWQDTVNAAKAAAASNPAWLRAIERADNEIRKSRYWAFDGATLTIQSTTSKKLYRVGAAHTCEAQANGHKACKHLAAHRLMTRYAERLSAAPTLPARSADERAALITDIKATWSRVEPHLPLATELMARFGKSNLSMLDTDMLRRVRLAIAM